MIVELDHLRNLFNIFKPEAIMYAIPRCFVERAIHNAYIVFFFSFFLYLLKITINWLVAKVKISALKFDQ